MDLLSLILAIAGIGLTIALSDPAVRLVTFSYLYMRRRAWSAEEYRKGTVQNKRHFGYEDWSVHIRVDSDGSTEHAFDARIVNLGSAVLRQQFIPYFTDATGTQKEEIAPWAKSGRTALPVKYDVVDEKRSQGRIEIRFVPPISPGKRQRVKWGFRLPRVFQEGDDYFGWAVEVPYFDMKGCLEFDPGWTILYARWDESVLDPKQHVDPPKISNNQITWRVTLPKPGTHLRMLMGLGKRAALREQRRATAQLPGY